MDPLSVASNIIAIVGATRTAVRNLRKLQESLFAPSQIALLLTETTDTEAVIQTVQRILLDISHQPFDPTFNTYLGSLTARAMDHLTEINQLADDGWIQDLNAMDERSAKATWKGWLKSKDIHKLLTALRSVRQDIAAALTVLIA